MNLNYETTGINFNSKGKVDEIATPQSIADDMVTLFDYTDCNRKIWFDMYCKTGNFLSSLKKQGVDKNNIAAICQTLQSQMLVCRKLYGKILPEVEVEINIKSLESCKVTRRGQVYYISNWKEKVKNNHQEAYNIIKFVVMKEMEKTMSLEWTTEENFKINNIIMNPPYNPSDLYIDFVELAHKIASDAVVAITPAKCQSKDTDKDKMFRNSIMECFKNVVYYPDTGDVFNVRLQGGVMYFLCTNHKNECASVKNISSRVKYFNSESSIKLRENKYCLYSNKSVRSILNKVLHKNNFESFGVPKAIDCKQYAVESALGASDCSGSSSFFMFSADGKILMTTPAMIVKQAINTISDNAIFSSDNANECESFISYIDTKFVRFLILLRYARNSVNNNFSWEFVPKETKFDHILTDDELYKKYNLTAEEINIIESVIKERK